jgi:hypothetical protein
MIRPTPLILNLIIYFCLMGLVFLYFDIQIIKSIMLLLIINLFFVIIFFSRSYGLYRPWFYLIYTIYTFIYIVKGIIIYLIGLNTDYSFSTIRTIISQTAYVDSFIVITIGNILLITLALGFSYFTKNKRRIRNINILPKRKAMFLVLILVLIWVGLSSIIMYKYKVAIMGTIGVSLPYKLSGIFFYSRTIILPIILLYIIEKATIMFDRKLFTWAMIIYLVLSLSEIIIRASKAPLLQLIFFIVMVVIFLRFQGINTKIIISKKLIIIGSFLSLISFPIIQVYRKIIVTGIGTSSIMSLIIQNTVEPANQSYFFFINAIGRLFDRLVGFIQLAGIVNNKMFTHDYNTIMSYTSIARYYTEHYLDYHMAGHLSSPSILGALIIIFGSLWPILFVLYFMFMTILWKLSSLFIHLSIPIQALLLYETFNTIMGGSIDTSLFRILIMFFASIIIEFLMNIFVKEIMVIKHKGMRLDIK